MKTVYTLEQAKELDEADAKCRRLLEQSVGSTNMELVKNEPEKFLHCIDAKVRLAAFAEINAQSGITQDLADRCEVIAINDADSNVRGMALICLSKFSAFQNS